MLLERHRCDFPTQVVLPVPEQKGQAFASAKLLYSTPSQKEAKPSPFIGFPRPLNPYVQAIQFHQALVALSEFPSEQQGIDSEGKAISDWIRTNTPDDALIVTPPAELTPFTWVAERPTVAKFKFIPPTKVGVLDWYERLTDLSGTLNPWPQPGERVTFSKMKQALRAGYNSLTTDQAQAVMNKYGADYLLTSTTHSLDFAIAYQNSRYILYAKSSDRQ